MRRVGQDALQARSAYQPVIQRQGDRWIAYIGHHGGRKLNPLTGQVESSGTSIVDVTDPSRPRYLHHIHRAPGEAEAGGASMARVCDGKILPKGDPAKTSRTDERCVNVGGVERCKAAIQANNVEVDDRGYVYIVDRADTGMHILELTGPARAIANFPVKAD